MYRKLTAVLVCLMLVLSTSLVQADQGGMRKWDKKKGLDDKIMCKAMFLIKNEDELGLSEQQVEKIKDIKYATKKELIRREADIDLVKVDIKKEMYQDDIDLDAVNALIDKKYDLKKAKAKYLLGQYAALKDVLTDEQKEKAKDLKKQHPMMSGMMHGPKSR